MRFFFAGGESFSGTQLFSKLGKRMNILDNYFYSTSKPFIHYAKNHLLDSGGFQARNKGVVIKVEDYARFINNNSIKTAFTLDTGDINETIKNTEYLKKETKSYIIPIFHINDFLGKERDMYSEYIFTHPYISVAGQGQIKFPKEYKKRFLDWVFSKTTNKIKIHGLAATSDILMERYPFFSVDSSSWLAASKFGSLSYIQDSRVEKFHSKETHYTTRLENEIEFLLKREKQITELWEKRGVKWE